MARTAAHIVIRSAADARTLRAFLPPLFTTVEVRIDAPQLDRSELERWQRHLSSLMGACGCGIGAMVVILTIGWRATVLITSGGVGWVELVANAGWVLAAGVAGKALGVGMARIRLHIGLRRLERVLSGPMSQEKDRP